MNYGFVHLSTNSPPTHLVCSTPTHPRARIDIHKPTGTSSLSLSVGACIYMLTSPANANPWMHR